MENIINVEFFEPKSTAMKHFYFLHSLLGGVFYENYVTRKFRYLCASYAIISYVILVVTHTIRIIQQNLNLGMAMESFSSLILLHSWIFIAVIIYLKREILHKLFDYFEEDLQNETLSERIIHESSSEDKKTPLEDISMRVLVIHCVSLVIIYLSKLMQKLTSGQEFQIDYETDFFAPIPFASSQTLLAYTAFFHLTFANLMLFPILAHGAIILPFLFTQHLKNRIHRLRNDIVLQNDVAVEYLDECFRREEQLMTNPTVYKQLNDFQLGEISRRRDKYVEEFMIKVQQWIKMYQRWITCVDLYKKLTTDIVTIETSDCTAGGVAGGYLLAKILLDSQETGFQFIPITLIHITWLSMVCFTGSLLSESGKILPGVIYSMPWYYFPKKDQKVLLNFLCMTQKDQQMKIFNMYPLSLKLYPTLLNKGYEFIQLMRMLENKK